MRHKRKLRKSRVCEVVEILDDRIVYDEISITISEIKGYRTFFSSKYLDPFELYHSFLFSWGCFIEIIMKDSHTLYIAFDSKSDKNEIEEQLKAKNIKKMLCTYYDFAHFYLQFFNLFLAGVLHHFFNINIFGFVPISFILIALSYSIFIHTKRIR